MHSHAFASKSAYYNSIIDEILTKDGATLGLELRESFVDMMVKRAEPLNREEFIKELRNLIVVENIRRAETKAVKRAEAKLAASTRRKNTHRRESRKNIGVTAGRQPRRSHKPSGRRIRVPDAA